MIEESWNFTGIESVIQWLEETGLLDVITDFLTDFSVEALYAVLALVVGLITSAAAWGVVLVIVIVTAIVTTAVLLVLYILHAVGLMRIAKKLGVKHRFLAWIPYANIYLLGKCAEKSEERNGRKVWKWGMILLFTTLGMTVGQPIVQTVLGILLSFFPMLAALVTLILECSSLILWAMNTYCLYLIFKEFAGKTGGIILSICSLLSISFEGVFLFVVGCLKLRPAATVPESATVIEAV
ncbi:MAG: hypothetical protein IJW70_11085 [Clostridia bacterium]|nr:hypothetical protein [Clostridia bacterium]